MNLSETAPKVDRALLPTPIPVSSTDLESPATTGLGLNVRAILALVFDTFRQAVASKLMLLAVCLASLGVLACLSVRVEGPRTLKFEGETELLDGNRQPLTSPKAALGRMSIGFGLASVGNFRDSESQVQFFQALLARWAAGVAGTLLLLASTSGFLPEFLKPGASSILLAKPVPRWALLAGKVLGVVAFVAVLSGGFIVGTWLALGLRTGVWKPGYLLAWPLLVLQFVGLYSASVVAATCTRNATASLFAALACWVVCLGVNTSRESMNIRDGVPTHPPITRLAIEAGYWALPKPLDLSMMLDRAVSASDHFAGSATIEAVRPASPTGVALSIGSSLLFAVAMLGIAGRQLATTDY